jgi:type I restriction enzyme M protein
MDESQYSTIVSFIWGIADDVLRDLYVRGKYRDVILPMTVLRRLDAVLEPTKQEVLDTKIRLDAARITNQDAALRQAAGQAFYNTSNFTLKDLRARASQQRLRADFEAYLDGFSPNLQEILDNFEFRNQIPRLSRADALGSLIEKFLDPRINLSPHPVGSGAAERPGLDNHDMGTVFEELVRRFNEENNEEAGEHWTPRDVVQLMARLIFLPIADEIESGTYLLYDGALGTGGMLTVAEETLRLLAEERGKQVVSHLYGQEINAETYAICKADLLLKGEGEEADNVVGGPEYSTLSNDAFPAREFDFMLSNPPYGKSWKSDLERMGGKSGVKDPRFIIDHGGDPEHSLITRSSDGQMLFLANMLSKMKHGTKLGSRVAEVHNGSSLFTGDAGQGESNIRRWIIENDWLEAIVALPMNMFYNTGIATYVWVLSNRKAPERQGKVQLIDAGSWFRPLRKNLGEKKNELTAEDIDRVIETFLRFEETKESRILPNESFGYYRVVVERPLRIKGTEAGRVYDAKTIRELRASGERDETSSPAISKVHGDARVKPDPLRGLFEEEIVGKKQVVEYAFDPVLRDVEQVPLTVAGGVDRFLETEILPHSPKAWYSPENIRLGYEVNFLKHFYRPPDKRSLEEIDARIHDLEEKKKALVRKAVTPLRDVPTKPLGSVPPFEIDASWRVVRLWDIARIRSEKGSPDMQLLSVFLGRGVIPYEEGGGQVHKPSLDLSNYQCVRVGDLVLNNQQAWRGSVGVSRYEGIISPAYVVLALSDDLDRRFADYLFQSRVMVAQFVTSSKGVGDIQRDIHIPWLKNVKVPIPPLEVQNETADTLARRLETIEQRLLIYSEEIDLLRELRRGLLADSVSGLRAAEETDLIPSRAGQTRK